MKMSTQAFEARQRRTTLVEQIQERLSALYYERQQLYAEAPEDRLKSPQEVSEQIQALATAGVYNMMEFAQEDGIRYQDLVWICRKMINFVRQGGWKALEEVEHYIPRIWEKYKQEVPEETRMSLVQVRQKCDAYKAERPVRNTIHPQGRKMLTPEEKREQLARRAENRQRRLAAQPKKGSSGGNSQQSQKKKAPKKG